MQRDTLEVRNRRAVRGGTGAAAGSPELRRLRERFARFRQQAGRGARVPGELRAGVLMAVRQGATPGEVGRACGLSWTQLRLWGAIQRNEPGVAPPDGGTAAEGVRVFAVEDEGPKGRGTPAAVPRAPAGLEAGLRAIRQGEEEALELRLGRWAVTVRLVGPAATDEKGGCACCR